MPVYRSHLAHTYADLEVGLRVREARQRQGLTLREVSERADISMAQLSRIENERQMLEVGQAAALARILQVSWEALLPSDAGLGYQISREADVAERPARRISLTTLGQRDRVLHRNSFRPLADLFVGRHLEPLIGEIAPAPDDGLQLYHHHVHTLMFVLGGRVEFRIRIGDDVHREELGLADCLYYRSRLPHSVRALGTEPARTLQVMIAESVDTGFEWPAVSASPTRRRSEVVETVRERVAGERERLGWTRAQAAERAGMNERQIQQIECGDGAVRVDAVLKLARAFGRPLRDLIARPGRTDPPYCIQRAADLSRVEPRTRRSPFETADGLPSRPTYQPLASGFPDPLMYPYLIKYDNPDHTRVKQDQHPGEEFMYVLEGELELTTQADGAETKEVLHAGDAVYLDSSQPHQCLGRSHNPYSPTSAEVVNVFWTPEGEDQLFDD